MRNIDVKTGEGRICPILIERGIMSSCGRYIKENLKAESAVIITDDTVDALYGEVVEKSVTEQGIHVKKFVIPHGEESKNMENLICILNFLAEQRLTRSDAIIALGGGVVGDLAGFSAAVYLRGIKLMQIPTTLLAMVDSSVGGKTAVNLDAGKNLAGAFYQPHVVLCDPDALHTLPPEIYSAGIAEVIKYGMIRDEKILAELEKDEYDICDVIEACVSIKRDVVEKDEKDTGLRQILNFGHTPAHAIEKLSKYSYSHGEAVAVGMAIITKAAVKLGLCTSDRTDRLISLLQKFSLPVSSPYTADALADIAMSDKKRSGGSITLVLPDMDGQCMLKKTPCSEIAGIFALGLDS